MFGIYKAPLKFQDGKLFAAPTLGETYRRILKEHSASRINRIIENDTFEDSSSVYERFFLDCENEIRIVARGIKKEIFDRVNVIAAAKIFLMRDHSKLVVDLRAKDDEERYKIHTSEFFRAITDITSGTKKLETNFYLQNPEKEFLGDLPSVSFGDNRMYRARTYQPNGDYSTHANADVNFNDPEKVTSFKVEIEAQLKIENKMA